MIGSAISKIIPLIGPVTFFMINAIFMVTGAFMLVAGVKVLDMQFIGPLAVHKKLTEQYNIGLKTEMKTFVTAAARIVFILGIWLHLVGILGVVSVLLKFKCLLMMYINVLVVTLLFWVSFVSLASRIMSNEDLPLVTKTAFQIGLRLDYNRNLEQPTTFEKFVDRMQVEFECCGMNNYTDYNNHATFWLNHTKGLLEVPPSCCHLNRTEFRSQGEFILEDRNCTLKPTFNNSHIDQPCYTRITNLLKSIKQPIKIVVFGVPAIFILLILIAIYLMCCKAGLVCCL